MTQTEWEAYFASMNGRQPNDADVAAARASGQFQDSPEPASPSLPAPAIPDSGSYSDATVASTSSWQPSYAAQPIPSVAAPLPPQQTPTPTAQPQAGALTCHTCGRQLPSGSQFCDSCGTRLGASDASGYFAPATAGHGAPSAPGYNAQTGTVPPPLYSTPQYAGRPGAPQQAGWPGAEQYAPAAVNPALTSFWAWILGSLKAPFKGLSAGDAKWFGWISIALASILNGLVLATAAWKAVSGVGSMADNGLSSLSGILGGSLTSSGQDIVDSGTSAANGKITGAFFGVALGFFIFNLAIVLCIWIVRHGILADSSFAFSTCIDMVGRQLVLVNLILLVAELFSIIGVTVLVILLLIAVLMLTSTIVSFGIFHAENHRKGDDFYLKFGGSVATGAILLFAYLFLMVVGLATLIGSLS